MTFFQQTKFVLLCWLSLIGITLLPVSAEINEKETRGLYSILKPEYSYLSPLNGLALLRSKVLHGIRFRGNYGPENKSYKCHPQLRDEQRNIDCPQDYRTSLLQQYFPSAGGGQLVPNNDIHDSISHLTMKTLGVILKELTKVRQRSDFLTLSIENKDELINRMALEIYQTQYPDSYKNARSLIAGASAAANRIERNKKQETSYEQIRMREISNELKVLMKLDLEDPAVTSKIDTLQEEKKQLGLLLSKQKTLSFNTLEEGDISPEEIIQKINKTKEFKDGALRIAKLIINAYEEELKDPSTYPPYFIENVLLAFAWRRATDKEDLFTLVSEFGREIINPAYINQNDQVKKPREWNYPYEQDVYKTFKNTFKNGQADPDVFKKVLQTPERIFYLTLAYDTYDYPYPRILDFSTSYFPVIKKGEILTELEREKRKFPKLWRDFPL